MLFCIHVYVAIYLLYNIVKECDRLSIVTFNTSVQVNFGLMSLTRSNKEKAETLIDSIIVSGRTNLCQGLLTGN